MLSMLTVHNTCECVILKQNTARGNTGRKHVGLYCVGVSQISVLVQRHHTESKGIVLSTKQPQTSERKAEVSSNWRSDEAASDKMGLDKQHQTKRPQTKQYLAKWYQTNRPEINGIRTDVLNSLRLNPNVPTPGCQVRIHSHFQE